MKNFVTKHLEKTKSKSNRWDSFVFLLVIFIGIDQVSKYLAGDVYKNYNFAFSLSVNFYAMYAIYLIGIGSIVFYVIKHFKILPFKALVAWTLILSGAVSNVGERIVLGYVRDWISIANGIFNLADGYIISGIIILILRDTNIRMHANDTNNTNFI